jgi:hypothetical protein
VNPFQVTVSALCYSILRERCPAPESELDFPNNRAVRFVLDQHGRMAEFLRLPLACVTIVFGGSSILRHGKPFHRLSHEARWRQFEAWRNARLAVCRDLIRFYESFVIYYWYSTWPGRGADQGCSSTGVTRTAA